MADMREVLMVGRCTWLLDRDDLHQDIQYWSISCRSDFITVFPLHEIIYCPYCGKMAVDGQTEEKENDIDLTLPPGMKREEADHNG